MRVEQGAWAGIHAREPNLLAKVMGDRFVFQQVGGPDTLCALTAVSNRPKSLARSCRAFPDFPLHVLRDLADDAPGLLKVAGPAQRETTADGQTLNVLTFAADQVAGP